MSKKPRRILKCNLLSGTSELGPLSFLISCFILALHLNLAIMHQALILLMLANVENCNVSVWSILLKKLAGKHHKEDNLRRIYFRTARMGTLVLKGIPVCV
jgi:hypothetical protein